MSDSFDGGAERYSCFHSATSVTFDPYPRQLRLRAGLTLADLAAVDYGVSLIISLT